MYYSIHRSYPYCYNWLVVTAFLIFLFKLVECSCNDGCIVTCCGIIYQTPPKQQLYDLFHSLLTITGHLNIHCLSIVGQNSTKIKQLIND